MDGNNYERKRLSTIHAAYYTRTSMIESHDIVNKKFTGPNFYYLAWMVRPYLF